MGCVLFICSSIIGHLGCLYLLVFVNNVDMNICVLSMSWYSVTVWISLCLSHLEFIEILECVSWYFQFGDFIVFFVQTLFLFPFLSLSFWDFHYVHADTFDDVPWVSEILLIFLHSFFLFFIKLDNLFLLPVQICCWMWWWTFQFLYFSTPEFGYFQNNFFLLIDIVYLVSH